MGLPAWNKGMYNNCLQAKRSKNLMFGSIIDSNFSCYRIRIVTKSCMKVWVSKMKGDYERYLRQAKDKLWMQIGSVYEPVISEFLYIYS